MLANKLLCIKSFIEKIGENANCKLVRVLAKIHHLVIDALCDNIHFNYHVI